MKKIVNPFIKYPEEDFYCIGCSPHNKTGLNLHFYDVGSELITHWVPENKYMGYKNVLHGGMQALLVDEIAAWVVYTKCETVGVTSEMNIKYHKPVHITSREIKISGKLVGFDENLAIVECSITNSSGAICCSATVNYYCFPKAIAERKYNYPGIKAFYNENSKA